MRNSLAPSLALLAAAMLAGCGGGSEAPVAADPTEVPASASTSPAAFVNFTGSLQASETAEGLDVSKTVPPTSETDEPMPVT